MFLKGFLDYETKPLLNFEIVAVVRELFIRIWVETDDQVSHATVKKNLFR